MKFLKINEKDNVAVALTALLPGDSLNTEMIPMGHKFALTDIPKGAPVIKYGYPIGTASRAILKGAHVHTENLRTALSGTLEYEYRPETGSEESEKGDESRREGASAPAGSFSGFKRADGRAGIRNDIWILPTVGCVNRTAELIRDLAIRTLGEAYDPEGEVRILTFRHPYGCSQTGEDQENFRKALAALAAHPNAGGVLLLGLGCENSNLKVLQPYLEESGAAASGRLLSLNAQDCKDETEEGAALVTALFRRAVKEERQEIPLSKLVVGLKCGGSDGLSGITANPLIGAVSDRLIESGASCILTEVPEMFGAETILMNRAASREVFDKTVALINGFKEYFIRHDQPVYENPSPGNKEGGISTLEDKSLGCTEKAGHACVSDVLHYTETLKTRGLNLLEAPGNDLVSSTALVLSGAQLILFSTGRGTPFGAAVPTLKIATNSALFEKKGHWMDFDAGRILSGEEKEALAEELVSLILRTASGEKAKTESAGYQEIAVWKTGVTV